jgi:hypothetical protein
MECHASWARAPLRDGPVRMKRVYIRDRETWRKKRVKYLGSTVQASDFGSQISAGKLL